MYKLIIVDDEVDIREGLISNYPWKQMGFQVVGGFENGKEAYEYVERYQVDGVLCDIRMPKLDGLEFSKKIRENNLKTQIILISGYADFEYAREAMRLGIKEYILKPVQYETVITVFTKLKEELDIQHGKTEIDDKPMGYYNQIISHVVEYLDHHFHEATLEEASIQVGLSPNYLSRIFKRKMGKNFSEYLFEVKMKKAALLLKDVNLRTYEIAAAVGYDNPKNFSRAFKSHYGMTPREYREGENP